VIRWLAKRSKLTVRVHADSLGRVDGRWKEDPRCPRD
jgi:hypothetical protein